MLICYIKHMCICVLYGPKLPEIKVLNKKITDWQRLMCWSLSLSPILVKVNSYIISIRLKLDLWLRPNERNFLSRESQNFGRRKSLQTKRQLILRCRVNQIGLLYETECSRLSATEIRLLATHKITLKKIAIYLS